MCSVRVTEKEIIVEGVDSKKGEGVAREEETFESICAANQHDGLPSSLFDKVVEAAMIVKATRSWVMGFST